MPGWPHVAAAVLLAAWCSPGSAFVPGGPSFQHITCGPASCPQRGPGKALLAARHTPPWLGVQPRQAVLPWTFQPAIGGVEQTRGRSAMPGSVLRAAVMLSEDEKPGVNPLTPDTRTPSRGSSETGTQQRSGGAQQSGGLPARTGTASPNNAGRAGDPRGRGGSGPGDATGGERGRDGHRMVERGREGARTDGKPTRGGGQRPVPRGSKGGMGGARRADRQGERGRGQGGGIPHGNRPRPQQIALNSRIAACRDPTEVFEEVVKAGEINVRLNSVNLATALHRVAKTAQGRGPFQNLQQDPVYLSLLRMVEKGLLPNSGEFNPREIANTAWGIAKAGGTSPSTFKALAEGSAHRTLAGFKPQELANTVWAFATAITGTSGQERLLLATSVDQMLTLAENEIVQRRAYHNADTEGGLADFKPQELSNTIWAFSTVGRHDSGVYAAVVEEMKRRNLPDFVPQDLANSVWAIVTAGHACPELLAQVQEDALKRGIASFKTQEIANMVWALAKADHPIHPLLASVASDVRKRKLAAFQPQELSNIVWAFATQAFKAESLLDVVEEELLRRGLTAFKSQEIANTAWAFAKLGHTAEALFQTMEDEILGNRDLEAFVPQELANMLWSFAKLDHGSETVFQELSGEMLRRGLSTFKTQELSNAVWAHATNGHAYPGLFLAVETEALRRGINAFTPQDLANMVWAFGKADHVAALLFESLQREFEIIGQTDRGLSTFKPQELSNILWACAKTQHSAKCHFNKLEASARGVFTHAQGDAEDFSGRDDTTSVVLEVDKELFRYARTGRAAELMFEAVEEELLRRDLSVFNTQHLANIAWAFVFLKFSRFHKLSLSGTRLLVAVSLASDSRVNEFAIEELRQLGQVVLATRKRAAREMGFAKKVNEALRRYHLDMDAPESSIFHQEVSSVLRALGVPHHNEVKVFEGVYHIDVVVGKGTPTDPKGHIAIEVDGPTHFCAGSEEPNPHTALKRWLLRREGYRVISVPFFDWRTLQVPVPRFLEGTRVVSNTPDHFAV